MTNRIIPALSLLTQSHSSYCHFFLRNTNNIIPVGLCLEDGKDRRQGQHPWFCRILSFDDLTSSSAIAERPRCRVHGYIVMAKSGRLELRDNIYGHYKSIFNHCDVFGQQSNRIRRKTQNKGYYAVQGHSRLSRLVPIESPHATSY